MMNWIWLGLLILFGLGEVITVGLTSIWFAAGALAALLAALAGGGLYLQLGLFFLISILCLLAVRPVARKYLFTRLQPTNVDSIIGRCVPVTEAISNLRAAGAVRVDGLTWSARSADGSDIPVDTTVRILRVEGVKVFVEELKEESKWVS